MTICLTLSIIVPPPSIHVIDTYPAISYPGKQKEVKHISHVQAKKMVLDFIFQKEKLAMLDRKKITRGNWMSISYFTLKQHLLSVIHNDPVLSQ